MADGIGRARNLAKVVAEVRIGDEAGGDLGSEDSARHGGFDPSVYRESGGRNGIAGGLKFAGGLHAPVVVECSDGACSKSCRRDEESQKGGQKKSVSWAPAS